MARMYECENCEHVQLVGVIDNGLSGFADPDARCEGCGNVGSFFFGPGAAARIRHIGATMVEVLPPDPEAFRLLKELSDGGESAA